MTSAILRSAAPRSIAGLLDHAGNARAAASTAASTSAASLLGMRAHTSPVAGSMLSIHSPDAAGPTSPATTCGNSAIAMAPPLSEQLARVDVERGAGDARRQVGREEQHRVRNL